MWSSLGWKWISSSLTCKKTCFSSSADSFPDQSSAHLFTCSCFNTLEQMSCDFTSNLPPPERGMEVCCNDRPVSEATCHDLPRSGAAHTLTQHSHSSPHANCHTLIHRISCVIIPHNYYLLFSLVVSLLNLFVCIHGLPAKRKKFIVMPNETIWIQMK